MINKYRLRLVACLAAMGLFTPPLPAELANVAPAGTAYASGPLWAGDQIGFLIDGDRSRQIHEAGSPTAPFFYSLDLGKDVTPSRITIYPRQDGCCPERLRNFRVSLHQDDAGALGTEVWGTDVLTAAGENAGSGAGKKVDIQVPAGQTGRWVRVLALEDPLPQYSLQMTELEVYAEVPPSEINRALNAAVTANAPLYAGAPPGNIVDGNRGSIIHADVAPPAGLAYTINMGARVRLSKLVVWARQDGCCATRLTNYRVTVHPDNGGTIGSPVWTADLHTDGTDPGSGPGSKDELIAENDSAGIFEGQYIRIESLDAAPADYALQISEVEALGEILGGLSVLLNQQPANAVVGVGTSARFAVVANVVNGDAALLTYQWQKNGANIEGATSSVYQTPPVLADEDKSVYRCVISYPGLTPILSDPATLRIHLGYRARAFTNRPLWGGANIAALVDNDRAGGFHGDATIDPGFAYTIDLELPVKFEQLNIYPRQDGCCPERLKNFRVSVHKDNAGELGDPVWSADLFTDGTNPGSGAGRVVNVTADLDPAGTFEGQWIQILSLEDPVTSYALQMNEVEVLGQYAAPAAILSIVREPVNYSTVPGRTALFNAAGKVVNGDPALITYQWTRNGVEIPGATATTYRTPPLTDADLTAEFRCVISYPGVPNQTTAPAQALFDYNYAKGQPAFSNRPLWGPGNWNISQIVDGDRNAVLHGDQTIEIGMAYWVDLGANVPVEHIDIYPRQDGCCPERLANFQVSLHADNNGELGDVNWAADLFTEPGTNAGATAGTVVTIRPEDGFGDFRGSWLRILALGDPVPQYFLQMTEVEVYGIIPPRLTYTVQPNGLQLTWTEGLVESAAAVGGPWQTEANLTSPALIPTATGQRYFRVRR
ncbi:MAG: hypothetical protein JNN07_07540 [Verrucomicrobiales bacterium]|nr:hypothetical protein [Verrucomicrobiales bacterium]